MDIEIVKKLITKYEPGHMSFVQKALTGERYYRNKTDILADSSFFRFLSEGWE